MKNGPYIEGSSAIPRQLACCRYFLPRNLSYNDLTHAIIQRLLGHKSVLTTERVLGVKFEESREAILMLDGLLTQALG